MMTEEIGTPDTVLVTGGTGFLASWIIAGLLHRGYQVRTTVRDLAKADQVRAAVAEDAGAEASKRVEFAVADLLVDEGWDEAVAGVDYVMHTASPLGTVAGQDPISTAREGVHRVLAAAERAGAKRVVITSSGVTAVPDDLTQKADESVWANPSGKPAEAYNDSKILSERDAWDVAATAGFELVVVMPTFIQGPVLGVPGLDGSSQIIRLLLTGGVPAIPKLGWDIVDVRDVAELHILAMIAPEAAGQRLLGGSGNFLWWRDIAAILRKELAEHAQKVPTRTMPDLLIKVLAGVNGQMAMMRPLLGRKVLVDSSKAHTLLGWKTTRPAEQTIVDTANSLRTKGALRK
jgi:dihydroflavonol-4-reductase